MSKAKHVYALLLRPTTQSLLWIRCPLRYQTGKTIQQRYVDSRYPGWQVLHTTKNSAKYDASASID